MSSSGEKSVPRVPQRERGIKRVATLLEAASSLFAEKGYDAVTMTEVAARANAPIGSLYQFFPSKDALAEAILNRFQGRLTEALDAIEARAATIAIAGLAEALLGLLTNLQQERAAASTLIESRQGASTRVAEFRIALRERVMRILRAKFPDLPPNTAETMSMVLIQLIKAAARQDVENEAELRPRVLAELKYLMNLYITARMPG